MSKLEYVNLNQVHPDEFLPVLNDELVRRHLIAHGIFDSVSIKEWMNGKLQTDATPGCRVRAIYVDHVLAGWCGIQPGDTGFEIAIVLSRHFWGFGIRIFKMLMCWAHAFGHKTVMLHLLDTRPEYMFLKRRATKVRKTALLGGQFTTYWISVAEWRKESHF